MIYCNGYIQELYASSDPSFDSSGRPIRSEVCEGELIPCMLRSSMDDKRGEYKDGGYSRYAYEVHIQPCVIGAKRVRLYRADRSVIGEFVVQSCSTAPILNFTQVFVG